MGLDAYIFGIKENDVEDTNEVDVKFPEGYQVDQVFYWRKHHDLHNWMENLYYSKGGSESIFNCVKVKLNEEDIDELEKVVLSKTLYTPTAPRNYEFFFEQDAEFIVIARKELKNNKAIYYDSWW